MTSDVSDKPGAAGQTAPTTPVPELPVDPAEIADEIENLRAIVRSDPAAYAADKSLDARWLELIEQQQAAALPAVAEPAAGARARPDSPAAYGAAGAIVAAILPELRAEFVERFRMLPFRAQAALVDELRLGIPAVPPANAIAMENFVEIDPPSADLAREWGALAPRKLMVAAARMARALEKLELPAAEQAMDWFDNLSPRAYHAVMRGLVAGAERAARDGSPGAPAEARDPRLDAVIAELRKTRADLAAFASRPAAAPPPPARSERRIRRVLRDSEGRIAGFEEV
jgi:hypothetical protein